MYTYTYTYTYTIYIYIYHIHIYIYIYIYLQVHLSFFLFMGISGNQTKGYTCVWKCLIHFVFLFALRFVLIILVVLHIETNHVVCAANLLRGFHIIWYKNTEIMGLNVSVGTKCVKWRHIFTIHPTFTWRLYSFPEAHPETLTNRSCSISDSDLWFSKVIRG